MTDPQLKTELDQDQARRVLAEAHALGTIIMRAVIQPQQPSAIAAIIAIRMIRQSILGGCENQDQVNALLSAEPDADRFYAEMQIQAQGGGHA